MSGYRVLFVSADTATGTVPDALSAKPAVSVVQADTVAAATETVRTSSIDCVVTAFSLADGTGVELIRRVRETETDVGCILYTDVDPEEIANGPGTLPVAEYVDRTTADAAERLADLVAVTVRRRTQTAYPLPENEADRLTAVEEFDHDAPFLERAFDRVTTLATAHFGVDRAAVNIVAKHHQRILSGRGMEGGTLPREESICTYTILDDDVTVVEDASTDPRFETVNRLDTMDIRFYAGAPLSIDYLPVGTLCIYDDEPGSLSDADREYLELLAAETEQWLELQGRLQDDAAEVAAGGR